MHFEVKRIEILLASSADTVIHPVGSENNLHIFLRRNQYVPLLSGVSKATLSGTILLEFIHHAHLIWISMLPPTQQQVQTSWELLGILIAFYFESLSYCERLKLSRWQS